MVTRRERKREKEREGGAGGVEERGANMCGARSQQGSEREPNQKPDGKKGKPPEER